MSKTTNYQLTVWDYGDEDFTPGQIREDLAENFIALDRVLKAEETARASGLAKKAEVVTGIYTPDNRDEQFINLGFTPSLVLVVNCDGQMSFVNGNLTYVQGGLALPGHTLMKGLMEITTNGFIVRNRNSSNRLYMNYGAEARYYLAFR